MNVSRILEAVLAGAGRSDLEYRLRGAREIRGAARIALEARNLAAARALLGAARAIEAAIFVAFQE